MNAADTCHRHPDRLAVEHCETCQRPVCGACLWYTEAGHRLCPDHAADQLHSGQPVLPPERYADGIAASQAAAARVSPADAPYKGNSTDLTALAAAGAGLAALLSCAGLAWALPALAFVFGLVAWLQHRDAVNPSRARLLGLAGLAGGGVFLLTILVSLFFFSACLLVALAAGASASRSVPTPIPYTPFPTP